MPQINTLETFPQKFSKHTFTYHCCPETIVKTFAQVACIIIDDGSIFSGIARKIDEQKKRKQNIFAYRIFINSFFKSYIDIAIRRRALGE